MSIISKNSLIHQIILSLEADLDTVKAQARGAHDAATHEESAAENKYDTFSLESGYLASGLSRRVREIEQSLQAYRDLAPRAFDDDDEIRLTALVTLDDDARLKYFIGPGAAGLVLSFEQVDVRVITPQSPLGQQLLGKAVGEDIMLMQKGVQTPASITDIV
ncbi:transcription elongation factor GreAB [Allohahella marinimesophila]|uniref:GreA/GreB family elongation factor n=1 Tax=Allohahella marinimesophila TaxID=1054972 RepID=A0ABP7NR43_9GAMM